jgi:esterase/lipase superfamily enzyme
MGKRSFITILALACALEGCGKREEPTQAPPVAPAKPVAPKGEDQTGSTERPPGEHSSRPPQTDSNYQTVKVFFATDRKRTDSSLATKMFGGDRGVLTYGTCEVSIPVDHRMGTLESPSIMKFEFSEDPEKHIVLLKVSELDKKQYFADVRGARKQIG